MDEYQFNEAKRNWVNGNRSDINRAELIALIQFYNDLVDEYER